MGVATSVAIGLGAASAFASYKGAKAASKGAREAAAMQVEESDRAERIIDDVWMPYVNKGRESISTLGRLTAAPPGSRYAAADPTMGAPSGRAVPRSGPAPQGTPYGGPPQDSRAMNTFRPRMMPQAGRAAGPGPLARLSPDPRQELR